ncbi:PHP domain-containing protein [Anaerocolumna chitinilytica]|nr:PHP domain-containing protein [Anaerocolumna chitinilytica]
MKECIDLHIHTDISDGFLKPNEIVNLMKENDIKIASITDHDSVDGYLQVKDIIDGSFRLIPGIEISTLWENDLELHILGYGIDVKNKDFRQYLNIVKEKKIQGVCSIYKKLQILNIPLEIQEISKNMSYDNMEALIKHKYPNSNQTFYNFYYENYYCFHIKPFISTYEALNIIRNASGYPIIAHLGRADKTEIEKIKILELLIAAGIKGIECYHPSHSEQFKNILIDIAQTNKLFITQGSDFHGRKNEYTQIAQNLSEDINKNSLCICNYI